MVLKLPDKLCAARSQNFLWLEGLRPGLKSEVTWMEGRCRDRAKPAVWGSLGKGMTRFLPSSFLSNQWLCIAIGLKKFKHRF